MESHHPKTLDEAGASLLAALRARHPNRLCDRLSDTTISSPCKKPRVPRERRRVTSLLSPVGRRRDSRRDGTSSAEAYARLEERGLA